MAGQMRETGVLTETSGLHELRIRPAEFEQIAHFARQHFGLDLKSGKEELVVARLSRIIRKGNFDSFGSYFKAVMVDTSGERKVELIDALTTNHTSFLREPAHFETLTQLLARDFAKVPVLRIWSAACSTGEEPYTLACCLIAAGRGPGSWAIHATDISSRVLAQARRGIYREEALASLPESWRRISFLRGQGRSAGWCHIRPQVSEHIRFERFNLIENTPVSGNWHVIFCRNVMIYFDKSTQEHVVRRLAGGLEPGGYLMVGHSESLTGVAHGLKYIQPATYQKPGQISTRRS